MRAQTSVPFGELLRSYRLAAGLTQEALAERAAMSPRSIRALESGANNPLRETMLRLTSALRLSETEQMQFMAAARPSPRRRTRSGAPMSSSPVLTNGPVWSLRKTDGTNLPLELTSFVGREHEMAELMQLTQRTRLLTLTGPGGVGKTRLALRVAAELITDFPDGVWFVELAPISDTTLVFSTIAGMFGIKEVGEQPLMERLKMYLRAKHLLLVLDNFEQVSAAGPLLTDLLKVTPLLKLLVTSRVALHLSGEQVYSVQPLLLPDLSHLPALEQLTQFAAIALFIQRARAAMPDFQLTHTNAPIVAEICVRLDGLPLAIELAAIRIKLLTPQAMLPRLESRLKLLTGGVQDVPTRQQTLRAAIDWSYSLLGVGEQRLFARLAIFVGGFTFEAAELICIAQSDLPLEALDGLQSLVDKSLVRRIEGTDADPRFAMIETMREYALERLDGGSSGTGTRSGMPGVDVEELRRRHAEYYLRVVEMAEPELRGPELDTWLKRLDAEHGNLRAALTWTQTTNAKEMGLRLVAALWWFWYFRGHLSEGRAWINRALAASGVRAVVPDVRSQFIIHMPSGTASRHAVSNNLRATLVVYRAKALFGAGLLAFRQHDLATARTLCEQSLVLFRELHNRDGIASALSWLSMVAVEEGDYAAARSFGEESVAASQELGDRWHRTEATFARGVVAQAQQDYEHAADLFMESLVLARELRNTWLISAALNRLAFVSLKAGDYTLAHQFFAESLHLRRKSDLKVGMVMTLEGFASLATAQGLASRAARLFAVAATLREAIGAYMAPADQVQYDQHIAAVRAEFDDATFAELWAEGQMMALEEAITYALDQESSRSPNR